MAVSVFLHQQSGQEFRSHLRLIHAIDRIKGRKNMGLTRWTCFACFMLALSGSARGEVVSGSSSADFIDIGIGLNLLSGGAVVDAQIHNLAPASGNAPPSYGFDNEVLNVNASAGVVESLIPLEPPIITVANVTADTVTSTVASDVDGLAGSRFASGVHSIGGLDLSIGDLPDLSDLISITADTIDVSSVVSGDVGSLTAVGTLEVSNLIISVSGFALGAINGIIAPNTGINLASITVPAGLTGTLSLVLNQQTITGDGINSRFLTTNAISLNLTGVGVSGIGTLNGNVTVGPTFAGLGASAVPEPSSAILLSLVCVGGVWVRRRSNRKAAMALEA